MLVRPFANEKDLFNLKGQSKHNRGLWLYFINTLRDDAKWPWHVVWE